MFQLTTNATSSNRWPPSCEFCHWKRAQLRI